MIKLKTRFGDYIKLLKGQVLNISLSHANFYLVVVVATITFYRIMKIIAVKVFQLKQLKRRNLKKIQA